MKVDDPTRTIAGQIPVCILAMLRTRRRPDRSPVATVAVFDCELVGFRFRGCFLLRLEAGFEIRLPTTAMTPAGYAVEICSGALRAQMTRMAVRVFKDLVAAGDERYGLTNEQARARWSYARAGSESAALELQACASQ
jgi:hypothetical protein